jgi:hypothetical protein
VGVRAIRSPAPSFLFTVLEQAVAKKPKNNQDEELRKRLSQPWISMRRGLIIMTITSIAMAGLTAWQVIPSKGWLEGILWGLLFGGMIWAIFFGNILINKILRR